MAISLQYRAGLLVLSLLATEQTLELTASEYASRVEHNPSLMALARAAMRNPGVEVEATFGAVDRTPYPRCRAIKEGLSIVAG